MVNPTPHAFTRAKPNRLASAFWLTDSLGAIPVAAGIALAVSVRTSGGPGMVWAALLLIAGGTLRSWSVFRAQIAGHAAATAHIARLRSTVHPALLSSRMTRGGLVGEDMHLAVDTILATVGHVARFLPLRAASAMSPLLIAIAIAPASWVSSVILLITLMPFVLALVLAGGAAARRADSQHVALNRLTGLFVDRVRSLPTIVGFGAEDRVSRHLGDAATDVARRTMDVLAIAFASSAILEFFAALSVALVAVYCGFSLLGVLPFAAPEHLTGLRAFYTLALAPEFYLAMRRLSAAYHDKQLGEAAAAALNTELARIPARPEPVAAPTQITGHAVAFTHPDGATIGPLDWCWTSPGLHVVTGPTGAGKSTVLLGLIGQVPIVAGQIAEGSSPLTPGAFNAAVGWAGQSVALLPGTLRDNLTMGRAEDAAIMACLQRLGLGAMLAHRGGLDMPIDHRGSGLSGGERRRIGLARAILSGRKILLLDEPTADLDPLAAANVRTLLSELSRRHLVIAASHDAELVDMAASKVGMRI